MVTKKKRNVKLMEAIFREYCGAARNPHTNAAILFLARQSLADYWPRMKRACASTLMTHHPDVVEKLMESENEPAN